MTAQPHSIQLPGPEPLVPRRFAITKIFLGLAIVGLVLSVIGAFVNPTQFAYSWFLAFYYFMTIALGSFFWVTLHYACDSEWSVIIRRTWENVLGLLPVLFVIFLPILIFPPLHETLWRWMQPVHAHDPAWLKVNGYLNEPFFYLRVLFYFVYFISVGLYYRNNSVRQDKDGDPRRSRAMHDHSYFALVMFGVLETFLGFDWFMGLDWRWYSSLFGVYNFRGLRAGGHGRGHPAHRAVARGRPSENADPRTLLPHGQAALRLHDFLGLHRVRPIPAHLVREHPGGDDFL